MNFKVIRRGFTVVEIVIVIVVIAVLAGVMVPTISNIVKKAQQSVDEQLVNSLNKILMAEEEIEGKNPYMHAAVLDLAENGYDLDSLKMIDEDNILVWDQNIDRFLICTELENRPIYGDNDSAYQDFYSGLGYLIYKKQFLWKIFTSNDYINGSLPIEHQKFSIYWGEKNAPVLGDFGKFNSGFDLGYYDGLFDFNGLGQPNINDNFLVFSYASIIVRGNFNSIQINNAGIKHFGNITNELRLFFDDFSADSYIQDYNFYEYGNVENVSVKRPSGVLESNCKFVAEQGAKFKQSLDEIKGIVGGESHFKNNGAEFNVSF